MRTAIIILVGFITWAVLIGIAKILGRSGYNYKNLATYSFIAVWFLVASANMWMGVAQAGYSIQEEAPIFLIIFIIPAAFALLIKPKL